MKMNFLGDWQFDTNKSDRQTISKNVVTYLIRTVKFFLLTVNTTITTLNSKTYF